MLNAKLGAGYERGINSGTGASTDHETDGNSAAAGRIRRDATGEAGWSVGGESEAHDVCGGEKKDCDRSAVTVEKN